MLIRKTAREDVPFVADIYAEAKKFMRESGNPTQWNGAYPNGESALSDIEKGIGYVCCDGDEIVAVFAFSVDNEPTYDLIHDGEWKKTGEYAFIHRIAVKHRGRGIIDFCFEQCFKMYPNQRIDTHRNNIPMQKVLKRNGFEYCGIIFLENGDERLAYQKV